MLCWLDGRVLDARDARVSPLDAGWRLGDGVFSTLLAVDGIPQQLDRHVARVMRDASALGIVGMVRDRLADAVRVVAEGNGAEHPDLVLRLVVTRGPVPPDAPFGAVSSAPTVAVLAAPAPAPSSSATVVTVEGGRRPAAIKSTSWAWSAQAIATARAANATTGLFVEDGDVLEAAAANVVVVHEGTALTPPADGRILPGTTREVLVDGGHLTETPVTTAMLGEADEVVLLSAVRGAVPVVAVDDVAVGDGDVGPVATALRATLREAGIGPVER